ncbi:MAG: hypothetical protein GX346_07795 [Clostridiales bacterium]|nr:hypothetical protein [Clostridiales bacterium]
MDLLSRKIELYETLEGKTSKWLNAWARVIVIILLVFSVLGLFTSLSAISAMFSDVFTAISFLISLVNLALLIVAVANGKKANDKAYFSFILIGALSILTSLIDLISAIVFTSGISAEEFASQQVEALGTDAGIAGDFLSSFLSMTYEIMLPSAIMTFVVTLVLWGLHILYMKKRKAIFFKTVEELEEEAGVSQGDEPQPYINPEG